LDQLQAFGAGSSITPDSLLEARLLRDSKKPVVILGRGEVSVALKVRVHRVSKGAISKIEAAGGSIEIIKS
jgi:large subunit ribosomal protein L15